MSELVRKGGATLSLVAAPVTHGEDVSELVETMLTTMRQYGGVGLAANQIGELRRVICIRSRGFRAVVINPELETVGTAMRQLAEGCLSFPGLTVNINRHQKVRLTGYTPDWEPVSIKLKSFEAAVAQHEVDHLNGVTIEDHR